MVPYKSTAEEVSFEWSHHRISATDSKVRTTLRVSITDSGSARLKDRDTLYRRNSKISPSLFPLYIAKYHQTTTTT